MNPSLRYVTPLGLGSSFGFSSIIDITLEADFLALEIDGKFAMATPAPMAPTKIT